MLQRPAVTFFCSALEFVFESLIISFNIKTEN
jgi:hypothetical protein